FPIGIDPVTAKKIIKTLNETEKKHLTTMLMSPLMSDGCTALKETQEFISQQSERAKAIQEAAYLIRNVGKAFAGRYKDVFIALWAQFANDETEELTPL